MASFNVHEAKTNLSKLLAKVEKGQRVTITRNGVPVADLVPHRAKGKRELGWAKGQFELPEGWDRPMTDEEVDRFLAGEEW